MPHASKYPTLYRRLFVFYETAFIQSYVLGCMSHLDGKTCKKLYVDIGFFKKKKIDSDL